MPAGKYPFDNAPDPKKAFEDARDDKQPPANDSRQTQSPQAQGQPVMRPRPGGSMREMANQVDRQLQREDQVRRAAERKAGKAEDAPGQEGRKPRRVTRLARLQP